MNTQMYWNKTEEGKAVENTQLWRNNNPVDMNEKLNNIITEFQSLI